MTNQMSLANLSQIEAMNDPSKSPEEMEKGDFDGDTISAFFIMTQIGGLPNSPPTYLSLGKHHKKSKLKEMSEKYVEELKDPLNPFHYKLVQLGYTEKEIEKFIEGAKMGFEIGFIKLATQVWGIDWEYQYEQFLKRQKEIESSILDSEEKK
jgi:hypothetical protein